MSDNLYGKKISLIGIVEEHLLLNDNEWLKLRLEDGATIIINRKYCREVDDRANKQSG